jgi:hypothetical protein
VALPRQENSGRLKSSFAFLQSSSNVLAVLGRLRTEFLCQQTWGQFFKGCRIAPLLRLGANRANPNACKVRTFL